MPYGPDLYPVAGAGGVSVAVLAVRTDGAALLPALTARNGGAGPVDWSSRIEVSVPLSSGGYRTCAPVDAATRALVIQPGETVNLAFECIGAVPGPGGVATVHVRRYGGMAQVWTGPVG